MSAATKGQSRHCSINLAALPEAASQEQLSAVLLAIDGVEQVRVTEAVLDIEYVFPRACFAEIRAGISGCFEGETFPVLDTWRYRLRAFMEANEQAHLQAAHDWYSYSRDIYLHYHALEEARQPNPHQQLWRRHQQTRRTGRRPT